MNIKSNKIDTTEFVKSVKFILDEGITVPTLIQFFEIAKKLDKSYNDVLGTGYSNRGINDVMSELIQKAFDEFEKETEEVLEVEGK